MARSCAAQHEDKDKDKDEDENEDENDTYPSRDISGEHSWVIQARAGVKISQRRIGFDGTSGHPTGPCASN
jgi:hypothetical protein